jgi:aryl-alcohol dehydrogenase-like predicted oxidoreductase
VHPIADLQIEYAIATRGPEAAIFPALAELGIGATLYGVLSRGLLSGSKPGPRDFRAYLPRFTGDAKAKNEGAVAALAAFARERGMTAAQAAVAWVLARQPAFVPIVGAKTPAQLHDLLSVLDKPLGPADVAELEALFPPGAIAGDRYATEQMRHLGRERPRDGQLEEVDAVVKMPLADRLARGVEGAALFVVDPSLVVAKAVAG